MEGRQAHYIQKGIIANQLFTKLEEIYPATSSDNKNKKEIK